MKSNIGNLVKRSVIVAEQLGELYSENILSVKLEWGGRLLIHCDEEVFEDFRSYFANPEVKKKVTHLGDTEYYFEAEFNGREVKVFCLKLKEDK